MAKEIREVIAVQEAAAAGDFKRLKYLQSLRGLVDYGEEAGHLSPSLPVKTGERVTQSGIEVVRSPLFAETQKLIEHMRKDGYAVYDLAGKTLTTLRTEGMPFWYINPALENASATPTLVAFKTKPSELFLKGSQIKPYKRQLDLLEEEKVRVERRYSDAGLMVRVGKPSEWSEASFEHFKATDRKVRIFGRDYGYNYTWADAYESNQPGARRAVVGDWHGVRGLDVRFDRPGHLDSRLGLAPLVEIPRK